MNYRVIYERDEGGYWVASMPAVQGCHTQGRTLASARKRIREALATSLIDIPEAKAIQEAKNAVFDEEIGLSPAVMESVRQVRQKRAQAAELEKELGVLTAKLARCLVRDSSLSLRDAGELLGLSHERVKQVI